MCWEAKWTCSQELEKLRCIIVDEEISDRVPTDGEQQGTCAVKGSTSDRVAVTVSRAERMIVDEQACDRIHSEGGGGRQGVLRLRGKQVTMSACV